MGFFDKFKPRKGDALEVKNIRLPKEFTELPEQQKLIRQDILTHAYGVTRTFADVVIALNKKNQFKSAKDALMALDKYFRRLLETGDDVAFTALRTFWHVINEPEVFTDGKLNVSLLRDRIFNFETFSFDYDVAYLRYCREKICNVVAFLNEFRQYRDPSQVIQDIRRSKLTCFSHCGPSDKYYLMSPVHSGNGYPMFFFARFLNENWDKIAPGGVLDPGLLNEYMFDRHERGLRKYGLEAVIAHDYVQDGPCHPEVYFPKRTGTGPVYVEDEARKYIRSCGEGKGPNSIPYYLENMIALDIIKEDPKYRRIGSYYVPINDMSLPVYDDWMGKLEFKTIDDKRRFIDEIQPH